MSQNQFSDAESAFRQAIAREPHHAASHYRLAVALGGLGRFNEAEAELKEAFELYPHGPKYMSLWRVVQHVKHRRKQE